MNEQNVRFTINNLSFIKINLPRIELTIIESPRQTNVALLSVILRRTMPVKLTTFKSAPPNIILDLFRLLIIPYYYCLVFYIISNLSSTYRPICMTTSHFEKKRNYLVT